MKKRLISFLLMTMMVVSLGTTALAVDPFASANLNSYTVLLTAEGNGEMMVSMNVEGVGVQEKIGVSEVMIEKKINGTWQYQESLDSVDHDDCYSYDSRDHMGAVTFNGTKGVPYRVTLTVYARDSSGSDTGYVTSPVVTCK